MKQTRRRHLKKRNKSKRRIGGSSFSSEKSSIMFGIPVNDRTALQITKYTGRVSNYDINRYLKTKSSPIRIQSIDGSGLHILGYNIENISEVNGELKSHLLLLRELQIRQESFQDDIKQLNPELTSITLSLYEAEVNEIVLDINEIEPYLFVIQPV
jgi:hypothetical protein